MNNPSDPAQEPEAVALDIADDFILVCEAASRQAKRTGNTFVLDRQRVANLIQAKLTRLTSPVSLDREAKIKELIDLYFAPWGAAKAVRWEDLTGDRPFNAEEALRAILALIEGRT